MNWLKAVLVTLGPRVIAALGGVIVAKAAQKGVTLDPVEVSGVVLAAYAAIHKAINSKVNPGDAAKGRVAAAEKSATEHGGVVSVSHNN